jgi:hypothetical protein
MVICMWTLLYFFHKISETKAFLKDMQHISSIRRIWLVALYNVEVVKIIF